VSAWVLVTVRGRQELTRRCLDSLIETTPSLKLIVIDNGSRDETLNDLYKRFRLGQIHRLVCNKVNTVPQWEKGYAIRQAARLLKDETADLFAWVDNDIIVKPGWIAAAQFVLQHLQNVEVCSMHNDPVQEKRHKTVSITEVGPYSARMKKTANGAIWVMRWEFFEKNGLPPVGKGINREGTEDWFYSDKFQQGGNLRFAVVDGFSEHLGYQTSLKRQAIAATKGYPVGVDK